MATPSRFLLLAAALLATTTLAACSGQAEPEQTPTPDPVVTAPVEAPSTEPEPDPEPVARELVAPTCEEMLYTDTLARFAADGWTADEDDFRVGPTVIDGGIVCFWADEEDVADEGQLFGWAPIEESAARSAQDYLVREGWQRITAPDGVYITENPDNAFIVDDDGYGMTYFFGDGWALLADVRQNLALIEWRG